LPIGFNLISNETAKKDPEKLECPRGFFCPYVNVTISDGSGGNVYTQPVLCPPFTRCAIERMTSRRCLVSKSFRLKGGDSTSVILRAVISEDGARANSSFDAA
jgi:hypothetical protein